MPKVFTKEVLDDLFTYHSPNHTQQAALTDVRKEARMFADVIIQNTFPGRDQETAMDHLRAAVMFANASIVLNGE